MAKDKGAWYQGDAKFEDLAVDQEWVNVDSGLLSTVKELSSSTVLMFNLADPNYKKQGKADDRAWVEDDETDKKRKKLKGINSLNWYTMDLFNRQFKKKD